jgi:cell shape-determining protein MreC
MLELKKENQVLRNDNLQKNTLQWENELIKQEKDQLEDDMNKKKSEFVKSLAEYKSQKEVTTGKS